MAKEPINYIEEADIELVAAHGHLNDYQTAATKSAIYPGRGTPIGLMYCAGKLNGESGELIEHVGKAMRDDNLIPLVNVHGPVAEYMEPEQGELITYASLRGKLTPERHAAIVKEIGDGLWYLSAICNELGISLKEAAVVNLHKLRDRQLRDVQRGSGDSR